MSKPMRLSFQLLLLSYCCFLMACQESPKPPAAKQPAAPPPAEKPAAPATSSEQDVTADGGMVTKAEFQYVPYTQKGGQKPQMGDYVTYHLIMRADENVMFDSHTRPKPYTFQIPDTTKINGPLSPTIQGLIRMGVGDSLRVVYPLPPGVTRPANYPDAKALNYDFTLLSIKDSK